MPEKVSFINSAGMRLAGNLYRSRKSAGSGVIFSHGLFSSKDGYKITRMAEEIAGCGYDLLAFDFSFAGESGGDIAELSVLQEVEDLRSAADFFTRNVSEKVHFVGSSMGAAVSLLYLSGNPEEALSFAGIATPADLRGLITGNTAVKDPGALPPGGRTELQGIMMNNSFFLEIDSIKMGEAMAAVRVPVMAIHGAMDTVVPVDNVEIMDRHLAVSLKKIVIADGDHHLVRDSDVALIRDSLLSWFAENTIK